MSSSLQRKILDLGELLSVVKAARDGGKTIVQCHGCFDIVHPGHVRYLEFARQQGDVLIVSLTGDSDMSKGHQRPYIPQELRAENLAALMFVDYVYIDPSPAAEGILAQVKPDVYVKGREYEHSTDPAFLAEKGVVEAYGGRIIFSSGEIVFSSTELIERMSPSSEAEAQRLALVAQRYGITPQSIEETSCTITVAPGSAKRRPSAPKVRRTAPQLIALPSTMVATGSSACLMDPIIDISAYTPPPKLSITIGIIF